MTDTDAPWERISHGGPSRYRALPHWELHTVNHDNGRRFQLRDTATGHTETLDDPMGSLNLHAALDLAEIRIAAAEGTNEHLSPLVLSLLDSPEDTP